MNISLYTVYGAHHGVSPKVFLYELLQQRTPEQAISHKEMPSWHEHTLFVNSKPYKDWFIIYNYYKPVGSIYLSKHDEIGLFIHKNHQGCGYGRAALNLLLDLCPENTYYANINPKNENSKRFFHSYGFVPYSQIPNVQDTFVYHIHPDVKRP